METMTINIYNQFVLAAKESFAKLIEENQAIQPGNYSAAEIEKQFNISGKLGNIRENYIERNYSSQDLKKPGYDEELKNMGYWGEILEFSFESFKCSIVRCSLFAKMAQWESAFRIPAKNKVIFTKEEKSDIIASLGISIPKAAKVLAEYADNAKYSMRPNMTKIFIDLVKCNAVASDTYILGVYPVNIENKEGEINKLWIDPKTWKKIAGQSVKVEICKNGTIAKIYSDKGEIYQEEQLKANYPDYERVLPAVNKDGMFQIADTDIKKIKEFTKNIGKDKSDCIKFKIAGYSGTGIIEYKNSYDESVKTMSFALVGSPKLNIEFGVNVYNIYKICNEWNGVIWFTCNYKPIMFDSNEGRCTIVMPMQINSEWHEQLEGKVPALKRHEYDMALSELNNKKTGKKEESTKPHYYPIATTETVIDFPAMIESATKAIESDIINGIIEIEAILDTLSIILKEIPSKEKKNEYSQYITAETQNMAYSPETFSGPAKVIYPDNCHDWAGYITAITWDDPCGTPITELVNTDWDNLDWNEEYQPPINMDLVLSVLNVIESLKLIIPIMEMIRKAVEIEDLALNSGIVNSDNTEMTENSIENEINSVSEPELIPNADITDKSESDIGESSIAPDPVNCNDMDESLILDEIPKQGIIKRLSRSFRKVAAVFF